MDKPVIGIRQADGSFYEIMDGDQSGRKRLVLSAARTDQKSVRIDLFRSEDGTLDAAAALGSISLDDPDGLGFNDIEFRMEIDDSQLEASAALPDQPPQRLSVDLSPFQGPRSDADILGDESLAASDLDTLDDTFATTPSFDLEPEAMTLDLPGDEELASFEEETPHRSDAEILGDEEFATAELDSLDDFEIGEAGEPEVAPESAPSFDTDNDSFDLGDLDAGFADTPAPEVQNEESWEKISLDDMEPMEFMDTGHEISQPSRTAPAKPAPSPPVHDDFAMDDEEPLDLGDMESDFGDLPDLDLGSEPAENSQMSSEDEFDSDFLPPPALTESPIWEPEPAAARGKAPKPPKAPKPAKSEREVSAVPEESHGLDKTALFLSLAALSLLVLLILVLLFLNMIKAPTAPVIQPEVMGWNPAAAMATKSSPQDLSNVDLAMAEPTTFEAGNVLEVPEGLRHARISMKLEPGLTREDATRRFGPPARAEGNQLFW